MSSTHVCILLTQAFLIKSCSKASMTTKKTPSTLHLRYLTNFVGLSLEIMWGFALPCLKIPITITVQNIRDNAGRCFSGDDPRRQGRSTGTAQVQVSQTRQCGPDPSGGRSPVDHSMPPGCLGPGTGPRQATACRAGPRARPRPLLHRHWPEVLPLLGASSGPGGSSGGGDQGQNGVTALRPRRRAGSRAVSARGPERGGRAPAECGSASPRTRPRPAASGPDSPLCPSAALRPGSRRGRTKPGLALLPLGFCGRASHAGREGSQQESPLELPRGAPG